MLARGSNHKKTAKFKGLPSMKTTALLPIVAALVAACGSSGGVKENEEFGFNDETEPQAVEEVVVQAAPKEAMQVEVAAPPPQPKVIAIRDGAPSRYTVKRGDTLWDISKTFLAEPWLWPEVWYFNPQIVNPHLIYPGDTLVMSYVGNRPQIRVERDSQGRVVNNVAQVGGYDTPTKVVKLSPRVRTEPIEAAIPTVPINAISSFLSSSRVLTLEELETAPTIVGTLDNHLVSGPDTVVYAVNLPNDDETRYEVMRKGRVFRHHQTDEILGYEALEIGEAKLTEQVNKDGLATFMLEKNKREVLKGDLLATFNASDITTSFLPSPPEVGVSGRIIALHNAIANVARNQVVIVDIGSRDGLKAGNVLAIDQTGEVVREKIPGSERRRNIQLPDVRAGLALVFRVFDRVSYALIVDSTRTIHNGDKVRNPEISKDI